MKLNNTSLSRKTVGKICQKLDAVIRSNELSVDDIRRVSGVIDGMVGSRAKSQLENLLDKYSPQSVESQIALFNMHLKVRVASRQLAGKIGEIATYGQNVENFARRRQCLQAFKNIDAAL
ncbi:hypothetical protein [Burkholderia ubonensis]|uniref:hypothetical protein n=1 Tax=Burkholderia ubonensis TaxID=101571 RepID=UPI0012F991C1|nr:hypothetical protein [Burkholderia ubonensis]